MKLVIKIFALLFLFGASFSINAKEVIEIQPIFEYPVTPEELESLEDRCNYLVKHFWDNFDFKNKQSVDQYALNEAMQVYVSSLQYASYKEGEQSLNNLINKISSSPLLLLQFTKAAEENLYGPRALFWSDPLYLKFLDAVAKNKKISPQRKEKYLSQAQSLRKSMEDMVAPSFKFTDQNGETKNYFPMSTPTLLIFGEPDDTDWRLQRLKMESNFKLQDALDKGKLNILYIVPAEIPDLKNQTSNYNKHWTLGQSAEIKKDYDIRLNPSVYLVGSDGKIRNKNISIEEAVANALQLLN